MVRDSKNRIKINQQSIGRAEAEKVDYLKKFDLDEESFHTKISEFVYQLPGKIEGFVAKLREVEVDKALGFYEEFCGYINPDLNASEVKTGYLVNKKRICRVLTPEFTFFLRFLLKA